MLRVKTGNETYGEHLLRQRIWHTDFALCCVLRQVPLLLPLLLLDRKIKSIAFMVRVKTCAAAAPSAAAVAAAAGPGH